MILEFPIATAVDFDPSVSKHAVVVLEKALHEVAVELLVVSLQVITSNLALVDDERTNTEFVVADRSEECISTRRGALVEMKFVRAAE